MGTFKYALIAVFVIEFALFLFGGTDYSKTSVFNLIQNPSTSNVLYAVILVAMGIFVANQIIPGNLWQVNQLGVYATVALIMISFSISIFHLSAFVYGELVDYTSVNMARWVTMTIVAPFLVTYILATAEWIRSNT